MTEENQSKKVEQKLIISYVLKPLSPWERFRVFGKFLAISYLGSFAGVLIFLISFSVIQTFPYYVPVASADDLLKILIQADGILLGFVGIIFAQLLASIMDQQNVLYQHILEKHDEVSSESKLLEFLGQRKFVLSLSTLGTFLFLLMSIFSSMLSIARLSQFKPTDSYATFGFLFAPLSFVIIAVVFLIIPLVGLPLKLPLEKTQQMIPAQKS